MLCKIHRATNKSKVIDNIAKRYGHEVLRLPPYHRDLNAIDRHSLFTHYVLIYNSVMNKVIRRSYRRKRNSKNTWHSEEKKTDIFIHLGSHGASSSRNISFLNRCILPTAEDMNLFIMVTVTPSKGRGKPPNSNIIFCCLSKLLIK